MATLLAKNADVLVTMDGQRRELRNAGLYAEDGFIRQVGPTTELPATADTVIDLSGQIVLPGFVNTHHHLNQTLTRNFPGAQDNNLFPWLKALYRAWARIDAEGSRASTLIGLAELAQSGCTTVFDHTYLSRTATPSTARSRRRASSACASMPAADRCRSASPKAACRRTTASRTRTSSSRTASG
jgi:8-oxoguanine deaminase